MVFTLLIPQHLYINAAKSLLVPISRGQMASQKSPVPITAAWRGLARCHLKLSARAPARRRRPRTTTILPGGPLISSLQSRGGSLITAPLINERRAAAPRPGVITGTPRSTAAPRRGHAGTRSSFLIGPYA